MEVESVNGKYQISTALLDLKNIIRTSSKPLREQVADYFTVKMIVSCKVCAKLVYSSYTVWCCWLDILQLQIPPETEIPNISRRWDRELLSRWIQTTELLESELLVCGRTWNTKRNTQGYISFCYDTKHTKAQELLVNVVPLKR